MAEKRARPDWDAIEREYRAGQLSIREIARQHGVSDKAVRNKAKAEEWPQDLSSRVREMVRAKLVSEEVRTEVRTHNADQKEAIETAATRGVELVRSHRRDIARMQALEQKLLAELGNDDTPPTKLWVGQYQGNVVTKEVGIAVTERASALQALAGVQHKRIQLERQAFNLDGAEPEKPMTQEQRLARIEELQRKLEAEGL